MTVFIAVVVWGVLTAAVMRALGYLDATDSPADDDFTEWERETSA